MKYITSFISIILNIAIRATLLVIIFVISAPLAYFTWRSNQPMELPQFDGLTYYQLINTRRQAYADLAHQYQASHPNQKVNFDNCFLPEIAVQVLGAIPNAGFYALASIYPELQRYVDTRDLRRGLVLENATWPGFLPAWWETYEKFVWKIVEHAPHGPVPYCRIPPPDARVD